MERAVAETNGKVGAENTRESVIWEWTKTIVYAVILALFIRTFFLQTFKIPTGSMEPTLRGAMNYGHGDKIIVIKFLYGFRIPFTDKKIFEVERPERGDVVVFETKGIEGLDQRKDFIKRVVALGGERVQIVADNSLWNPSDPIIEDGGHIYINGKRLTEPADVADRKYYPVGEYGESEVTVPANSYFMLGDNSLNSRDSRFWGFVPDNNVVGKAVAIYWPPNRIGLIH